MATDGNRRCQVFWLPKHGHTVEEYEDAWAIHETRGYFALADGATESSFAGEWARLLVADFVAHAGDHPPAWFDRLLELQGQWWAATGNRPLPWYAEAKRDVGAFATFLGFALNAEGTWHALAIGDSCLFHLRRGKLLASFPIDRSEEFGNQPWLLGSRHIPTPSWYDEAVRRYTGEWKAGDQFWLLTDAVAHWLLRTVKHDQPCELPFLPTMEDFAVWVTSEREAGTLRNDDCTWMVLATE